MEGTIKQTRINRNRLDTLYSLTQPDTTAEPTYFFHPDHLGSASWITDLSGQPVQHLQYKPFGGDYIDQQDPNTEYSERFRFTGKERDAETGFDYFGARYYSSSLGIWLSVDPMSDKYPSLSPYVYCADNPMRLVDPSGRIIEPAGENEQNLYNRYKETISNKISFWQNRVKLREMQANNAKTWLGRVIRKYQGNLASNSLSEYSQINNELSEMENSQIIFKLRMGDNIQVSLPESAAGLTTYNIENDEIDINIGTSSFFNEIQIVSHELLHGFQYLKRELDFDATGLHGGLLYDKNDEIDAYKRGNLFGNVVNPNAIVSSNYKNLSSQRKSYHLLSPNEKKQYDAQKANGKYR